MSCLPRLNTSDSANRERLDQHYDDRSTELARKRRYFVDQLNNLDREIAELAWSRAMHIGTVAVEQ
jgi:hypothetical protein